MEHWLHEKSFNFSNLNFQETWLKADSDGEVDTSSFIIEGYNAFAAGATCSAHGGVVSYVEESLKVEIKLKFGSKFWDGIFLLITGQGIKPFLLANIYRAPRNDNTSIEGFFKEFKPIIQSFNNNYKNMVICGDINLDLIRVNEREKYASFLDFMLSVGLCPKITFPTRFAKYSASLLDVIFIKNSDEFLQSTTKSGILYSAISDHCGCFTVMNTVRPKEKQISYVEIVCEDNQSMSKFYNAMLKTNTMSKLNKDVFADPNETYITIEDDITRNMKKFLPTKQVKFNKYKHKKTSWITTDLMQCLRIRDNLYRRWKSRSPSAVDYITLKSEFHSYSKNVSKLIRHAKLNYYQAEFDKFKGNIKKKWRTINAILNRNRRVNKFPSHIISPKGKICEKQKIVNELNEYFCNVGQTLAKKIPTSTLNYSNYLQKHITSCFSFSMVDTNTVTNILKNFKPKSSKGWDGISMKILKFIASILAEPLKLLINQSLMTNIFPTKLKIAKILPLLKKPNNYQIDNFRPISLLPCISKVIEKCVFNQVYEYFERNKLIYGSQYGYRKSHSTETACLELVDKLHKQLDTSQSPFCVFIDLSKAFDTINHAILLSKLKYYGLDDNAVAWFNSYLTNRKQFVEVEGVKSEISDISTGVPQGSTLGPLLFIIYMNDINDVSNLFETILFADDTFLNSIMSLFPMNDNHKKSQAINKELHKITDWLRANKLSLNVKKTKYMLFRYSQKKPNSLPQLNLKMNGFSIEKVKHFNFLGLTISETLSWKPHLDKIRTMIAKTVGTMNRIKNQVNKTILLTIYNSLILSRLHYGILCWGAYGKLLFRMQKKAVRIIFKTKYNAHTDPLFKDLKLLKIEDIFRLQCLKFYFKLKNNNLPSYFISNFNFLQSSHIHHYNLRRTDQYRTDHYNRHTTKNTLRYIIPNLLNAIPTTIIDKVATHSLDSFKSRLKSILIDKYETTCEKVNCYVCSR